MTNNDYCWSRRETILREKSVLFAVRVMRVTRILQELKKAFVLSKQLLRCETAIGASVWEGLFAERKADVIHKNPIAQKEASNGLTGWNFFTKPTIFSQSEFQSLYAEVAELLTATLKTAKASSNH